jgi:hypothetical protein
MTKSKSTTITIVVLSILLAAALAASIVLAAYTTQKTTTTTISFASGLTLTVSGAAQSGTSGDFSIGAAGTSVSITMQRTNTF